MIKKILALLRNAKHPVAYVWNILVHYKGQPLAEIVDQEYADMHQFFLNVAP